EQMTSITDGRPSQTFIDKWGPGGATIASVDMKNRMIANSLQKKTTMWHGHSQGGAQITEATDEARKGLAGSDMFKKKASRDADRVQAQRLAANQQPLNQKKYNKLVKERADFRANRRLDRRNMFSYSGAASVPKKGMTNATSAKCGNDI